jgi:hypothetical protein
MITPFFLIPLNIPVIQLRRLTIWERRLAVSIDGTLKLNYYLTHKPSRRAQKERNGVYTI